MKEDTAKFVLAARETLDLTQAELASKIGRNRKAIIRYEQGEPLPTAVHLAIMHLLTEHDFLGFLPGQRNKAKQRAPVVHLAIKQWLTEQRRKRKRAKRGKSNG